MSDIIYYNCVSYGTQEIGVLSTLATFEETRLQPFLLNPDDYYMTIIRFSIDASHVPLFVCPVIPNPNDATDINYTPFVITLTYNNNKYSANLKYIPNDNISTPSPPNPQQDLRGEYYFVYYITILIKMINNAINEAYDKMETANPILVNVARPYVIYDTVTEKISIIVPNIEVGGINLYTTEYDVNTNRPMYNPEPPGKCCIFVNNILYAYIESIESYVVANYLNYLSFLIIVSDTKNNYYYPSENDVNTIVTQTSVSFTDTNITYTVKPVWFKLSQQYKMITAWNGISNIVFFTQMPIQQEYIPSISRVSGNVSISGSSGMPIMTDFIPNIQEQGGQRNRYNYYANGPYRLININSTIPITKIQFSIYWQDKYQNLYPMRISSDQTNSVKIAFIKKNIYKSTLK